MKNLNETALRAAFASVPADWSVRKSFLEEIERAIKVYVNYVEIEDVQTEPAWTDRLAHVQQWTPTERQCAYLKDEIEGLGAHPLLTDALNAVDLAMRTLGKWHDDGEPGREPSKSNIRQGASGYIFDSDYARDILHIYPTSGSYSDD